MGFRNTVKYSYSASNLTEYPWVSSYTTEVKNSGYKTYSYAYDNDGNIVNIHVSLNEWYRYVYDHAGQLVREDNALLNETYVYEYDNAGNIRKKYTYALTGKDVTPTNPKSTYSYSYGDADWGDKLTAYRGQSITYDEIGNPLSYYNGRRYTFTWENGRRLATAEVGENVVSFRYNDEGIRTGKNVNGVEHSYSLNGSQIIMEDMGGSLLVYLYDASGSPIGMQYRNRIYDMGAYDNFWFEKNLQGDIVAVYDEDGTKLISYAYDAWGNFTTTYHNGCTASNHANLNPFRYRGYYYDSELGMYYLQSRYYDPVIGRFISTDGVVSNIGGNILGNNLYAYCFNNPINKVDATGNWPRWITAAVAVTAAVVFAVTAAPAAAVVTAVAGTAYAIQTWHFDARAEKNKGMEDMTYEEAKQIPGADTNVSDKFHDFSGDNNKVCLRDGREGIYDSSDAYVDDPRDIGTYNYFVPNDFWSKAGHIVVDVFPYLIFGNNDEDPGFIINFIVKGANKLIELFQ